MPPMSTSMMPQMGMMADDNVSVMSNPLFPDTGSMSGGLPSHFNPMSADVMANGEHLGERMEYEPPKKKRKMN